METKKKRKRSLLAIVIIVAGVGLMVYFFATRPRENKRPRPKSTPLVEVIELESGSANVVVEAMGEVVPADEVSLQAEVTGKIEWVHPEMVEGGFVEKGTVLIKVDDRDYRLAIERRRAALQAAKADLQLEEGRQRVAAFEWESMKGDDKDQQKSDLALRLPQLKAARAAVSTARAELRQAELDLSRTKIEAPFDAVVAEAGADVGDRAAPGASLARLVSSRTFWVKASVRSDQIKWLKFPQDEGEPGSPVLVRTQGGKERDGRLIKLAPELSRDGRMARVVIAVDDPLLYESDGGKDDALLLDEFVRVEITGVTVDDVVSIPRGALREGDKVWLLDGNDALSIVPVNVLWGVSDRVFVEDVFEPGSRLIVSSLAAPVEGMSLSVEGEKRPKPENPGKSE